MKNILQRLIDHQTLTREESQEILMQMANGTYNSSQIASFMTAFMMRPITVEELGGFRQALLNLCLVVDFSDFNTIDLCGTGGDGKDTFNISTLASFLVAGAGEKVAKHGNYGVSSACGSSNVMEYFGYKFSNNEDTLRKQLDKAGICFLHAPLFHPAMKAVAPIRKDLGLKTFFNILGPMVNPSAPKNQLVGVFNLETMRLYQYLYQESEKNFSIVHSLDGYDEISLTSPFKVVTQDAELLLNPEELGFRRLAPEELKGGNTIAEAASIFRNILKGEGTQAQNSAVIANAALALRTLHPDISLDSCIEKAQESLLSGKALNVFTLLIQN